MSKSILLTEDSQASLTKIHELVPNIEDAFIVETALAITTALYEKVSQGAVIEVKMPDGKVEELRFKVKKAGRKKPSA